MTDGCRETRRALGEAPCFFSMEPTANSPRASSGSYVYPEVAGLHWLASEGPGAWISLRLGILTSCKCTLAQIVGQLLRLKPAHSATRAAQPKVSAASQDTQRTL